jgi:hypothetical protein
MQELHRMRVFESTHQITERLDDGNRQTMLYNSKLQNLRT